MTRRGRTSEVTVDAVHASAYTVPTDAPESDGTLAWDHTTLVLAEVEAGGVTGIGYSYSASEAAHLVAGVLADEVTGRSALDVPGCWIAMVRAVRNLGRPGIAASAIAAVDAALWDCKARLLGLSLLALLGAERESVPVYGSGGFTSYSIGRLCEQLGGWAEQGMGAVKMKVGRCPEEDLERVREARRAIGGACELFVDANGAYGRKQALAFAHAFRAQGVSWLEEPVSSDDLAGLRLIRDRAPAGIDIAAGEYGYDVFYFRRMLAAGAVDVLQADATRCGGVTGFLRAATVAHAFSIPLSAHTAPTLHGPLCCAAPGIRHVEYFHDHARLEHMLFEGALTPRDGALHPDDGRLGLGIELRRSDAARFAA